MRTKKRTPTAANVTLPGENNCDIYEESKSRTSLCSDAHQANTVFKGGRKGIQHFNSRNEPLGPSIVATSRGLVWPFGLLMKDCENGDGRVAKLELGGEWVGK